MLLEADVVSGKDVRFRLSVPCIDAGIAYEVRGLCATFCKVVGVGSPQWADAAKSFQFAVTRSLLCVAGQDAGELLPGRFQTSSSSPSPPSAGFTLRSFLPDELCDGIKSIQVDADMAPGKDLHVRLSVPCADAGIAHEVRGLCESALVNPGPRVRPPVPPTPERHKKSFHSAVDGRCYLVEGTCRRAPFRATS